MKNPFFTSLSGSLSIKRMGGFALTAVLFLSCLCARAQTLKIGYTRIDSILAQTPEAGIINSLISNQQTRAQTELKRMQDELQTKYADYQKNGPQLNNLIRKDRETELQSLQTRIQEFSRNADAALQGQYKKLITPILTRVQQTIDLVAKENGYTYVLNIGSGNSTDILYAAEELNITELVIKKLDQMSDKPMPKPVSGSVAPAKKPVPKKK